MKKLLFGLIAIVMFCANANAQTSSKIVKITCITLSCCSVGPFGIEIWSETTCTYVSVEKATAKYSFKSNGDLNEVVVSEDVLLAGQFAENGDNLVLPAGKYPVVDNQIEFIPKASKPTKYCFIREVSGNLFGHEYEYSIKICVTVELSKNGIVAITPKLSAEQLSKLLKSEDRTFTINKDITISENGIKTTVKAGNYVMNEDGSAYLQNVVVK
jgi:hypothetical protein